MIRRVRLICGFKLFPRTNWANSYILDDIKFRRTLPLVKGSVKCPMDSKILEKAIAQIYIWYIPFHSELHCKCCCGVTGMSGLLRVLRTCPSPLRAPEAGAGSACVLIIYLHISYRVSGGIAQLITSCPSATLCDISS